jgi:hypothetical protein
LLKMQLKAIHSAMAPSRTSGHRWRRAENDFVASLGREFFLLRFLSPPTPGDTKDDCSYWLNANGEVWDEVQWSKWAQRRSMRTVLMILAQVMERMQPARGLPYEIFAPPFTLASVTPVLWISTTTCVRVPSPAGAARRFVTDKECRMWSGTVRWNQKKLLSCLVR